VEEQVVHFAVAAAVGEGARSVGVGAEVLERRPVDLVVLLIVDDPVRDRDRQVVPAGLLLDADREPERAAEPDVGGTSSWLVTLPAAGTQEAGLVPRL
jgi:hypothetical protein